MPPSTYDHRPVLPSAGVLLTPPASPLSAWLPKLLRGARFTLVGALGLGANQMVLWALVTFGGIYYVVGAAIATQASTAVTFVANELWVFRARGAEKGLLAMARRFVVFDAINSASLLLRLPLLLLLASVLHVNYLLANLAAIGVFTVVRFLVADGLIWRSGSKTLTPSVEDGIA